MNTRPSLGHPGASSGEWTRLRFNYRPTDRSHPARLRIFYGDGKGHFTEQIVLVGTGCHQGKLGDFDGDGDLDILQKDLREQHRVDVWFNEGPE